MPRVSLLTSFAIVLLGLLLIGGSAVPTLAQGDQATPPPDQSGQELGWLQLSAVNCTAGGEAGTVSILLAQEYVPQGECVDGYATLLVDGVDYGPVAPYLELQLEAGVHNLYDPVTGASRDVEIVADTATQVIIVSYTAPVETPTAEPTVEAAAETVDSELIIVAHACKPDVQSTDQLWALGNRTARLDACPAMTLPGYSSPGGTANGGEQYFDFTLSPTTGDAQTLTGNGAFVSDAFCESTVGALDNDPTNDRCVSNSGFSFQLPEGPITLNLTVVPDLMRFVGAEAGTDADAGIITDSDPSAWYLGLDTSLRGTDQPVVHLFYLNPPRVNVVMHLCGSEVGSSADLSALGSLATQLLTCPAVARVSEGGSADFGISVADGNWGARGLDGATFDHTVACESDIGDWNGDGSDNACVDAPTYRFDQTAMGYVTVGQDYVPAGYAFGGASSSDAGAIASVDQASGIVTLDTSFDGDITVHLFALVQTLQESPTPNPTQTPAPPSATATRTPTRTATVPAATSTITAVPPTATEPTGSTTGNGTLTVVALYCLTSNGTSVVALAPGASASESDLGGASCFAGDAGIQITFANGESMPAIKLGRDGVESIQNIPTTSGMLHTLIEGLTGQSATFAIEPGSVTRVIVKFGAGTAMVDEGVTSSSTGTGTTGGTGSTGGLVTDELIGDEGALFGSSYAGVSYTSLVVDDVDAQEVASVTDAKSLPGVGVWPAKSARQLLAMLAALSVLFTTLGLAARRDGAR